MKATSKMVHDSNNENGEKTYFSSKIAVLEVVTRCNYRCPHCFTDSTNTHRRELTIDEIKELFKGLRDLGYGCVALSGGEPFLRPDLPDIFAYGKSLGMDFTIVTNGTLGNEENIRLFKNNNLGSIQVSLDGPDPQTNSRIRNCPREGFYSAIKTMRIARDLGISVTLGVFLHKDTVEMVGDFVSLAQSIGVDTIRYAPFIPVGRGKDPDIIKKVQPSLAQIAWFENEISRINTTIGPLRVVSDCAAGPLSGSGRHSCQAGKGVVYIGSDGEVYPCTALYAKEFSQGNIFIDNLQSLMKNVENFSNSIVPKSQRHGKCSKCTNNNCSAGCPGVVFAYYGRHDISFPFCTHLMS